VEEARPGRNAASAIRLDDDSFRFLHELDFAKNPAKIALAQQIIGNPLEVFDESELCRKLPRA
jgi:hypothetical protein